MKYPSSPAIIILSLALVSCGITNRSWNSNKTVQPLRPQPISSVDAQDLQPLDVNNQTSEEMVQGKEAVSNTGQTTTNSPIHAALPEKENPLNQPNQQLPSSGAVKISRSDLMGAWTLSSNGQICQLIMTITAWSNGYRATTRKCRSPVLDSISAWQLENNEIILNNTDGMIAKLKPINKTYFSGVNQINKSKLTFYRKN